MVNVLLYLGCVSDDWTMAWVEHGGGERVQSVEGPQVATKILKYLLHWQRERERENVKNIKMI